MITVTHEERDRLRIVVRGHELFADQPESDGGWDTAPTPTEIFVAGLAACTAFYAERFLRRHRLSTEGLSVRCNYSWVEKPHRVGAIELVVDAPGLTAERKEAFERVVQHCTVHTTLEYQPAIALRVSGAQTAAVA
jgi:putative redox protein